ncbi:helix-turn-helix domain-containing protein [Desulfofalx alkaliphila]|uniref:helix-turn-helix domain-containing protein n=1 Tax=Desulfofalx alkaliphila TaxID=105483 RepID=UPI0004E0B446|nr:helix-turn-helix transcriptional regulator [Desulfofalx alkaliphila]
MDLGLKIKTVRTQQNISMNMLAKRADIAQSTLSRIESGQQMPTFDVLERIVSALGITLSDFFANNQEPEPLPPEVKQVCDKVKQLPLDKLKVLNAVLDSWD